MGFERKKCRTKNSTIEQSGRCGKDYFSGQKSIPNMRSNLFSRRIPFGYGFNVKRAEWGKYTPINNGTLKPFFYWKHENT